MISQSPVLFGVACIITFLVAYVIVKYQYGETLTLLKTRNETLTASLQEKSTTQPRATGNWLSSVAEHDRLELHTAVHVTECTVQESLSGDNPHVVFDFFIRNGSVYAITIDPNIKGFISLNSRKLAGEIITSRLPHNVPHVYGDHLQIRQELSAQDVAEIGQLESANEGQGFYDFGNLHITINGDSPTTKAVPARLQFKRVTRRRINNQFELI